MEGALCLSRRSSTTGVGDGARPAASSVLSVPGSTTARTVELERAAGVAAAPGGQLSGAHPTLYPPLLRPQPLGAQAGPPPP